VSLSGGDDTAGAFPCRGCAGEHTSLRPRFRMAARSFAVSEPFAGLLIAKEEGLELDLASLDVTLQDQWHSN